MLFFMPQEGMRSEAAYSSGVNHFLRLGGFSPQKIHPCKQYLHLAGLHQAKTLITH